MAPQRRIAIAFLILAGLLAAGCTAQPPDVSAFKKLRFNDKPQIALDVSKIEVVAAYRSPGIPPNVEHLFPVRPLEAALQWGRDRLSAAGSHRVARMVVRRASVTEKKLKTKSGLRGLMTKEQSELYKGIIVVSIQIRSDQGLVLAHANTRIERSQSVGEETSMAARERAWYAMTRKMMSDLEGSMATQIRRHLGKYIRN